MKFMTRRPFLDQHQDRQTNNRHERKIKKTKKILFLS